MKEIEFNDWKYQRNKKLKKSNHYSDEYDTYHLENDYDRLVQKMNSAI